MLSSVLEVYHPPKEPLSVLYYDSDLLVLSKPSGLLSVPGKGAHLSDCLESRARAEFPGALLVHRLDMDTSGIFVMALNKTAQAHIGKQFERRKVVKNYIADVWGALEGGSSGKIDLPLRCDWPNRPLQMVCREHGKAAQTNWEIQERRGDSTRMKLNPLTGRSHQLRVHMAALGHPILGDRFYAHEQALNAAGRLMLHAENLTLHHPQDGRLMRFTEPCPF